MKKLFCILITWSALTQIAQAEDIELYVKHNVSTREQPRVLMLFDTSGSMAWDSQNGKACYERYSYRVWTGWRYETRYGYRETECFNGSNCYQANEYNQAVQGCADSRLKVAQNAMRKLVRDNADIQFGLSRLYSSSGGYILNGIGSSSDDIVEKINALPASGSTPLSETLWELYNYLKGGDVYWGENGGNDRDKSIERRGNYISAFTPARGADERCDTSINLILMTDGDPTSDTSSNNSIVNEYFSVYGSYPNYFDINEGSGVTKNYLPALAKTMRGTSQVKVDLYPSTPDEHDFARVFTIGFGNGMSGTGIDLLKETATQGGGQYLHAHTANDLSDVLKTTITNIRNVSASFSSPTVSANAQDPTQTGNALYYTQFKPETHTRWRGNLKKLKFENKKVVGQEGTPAIDEKGAISNSITTFWSAGGSKDGNNIEKGGVNYALENQLTRKVLSDFDGGSLVEFTYDNAESVYGGRTQLADAMGLSGASKSQLQEVFNWVIGKDVDDDDGDGFSSDRRADIFADPLHSKPASIDYGNGDVRILVGTNAGVLHMFKDNGNSVSESWAFIPKSLLSILNPVKTEKAETKLYGMDGPITVYFHDINKNRKVESGDKVWAFVGMRRGGNKYYGFDITNPDSPSLLWGGPISGDSNKFKDLGQTWSKPVVSFIEKQKNRPVLIFAAGYNTNKDNVSRSVDENNKGVGIYMVDIMSNNADIVWSLTGDAFKGEHSIVAQPALTDSDYDGFSDRIYLADTAGSIWRIDMPGPNPNDPTEPWTHFELAQLGSTAADQDRRFFYKPTIARTFYSQVTKTIFGTGKDDYRMDRKDTPFDAIVIGSGNRAKPIDSSVTDYLFMVRDMNTKTKSFVEDIPEPIVISDLMEMKDDPFGNAVNDLEKFVKEEAKLAQFKGWKYQLSGGEKSLAESTVIGGVAYFTSFTPADQTTQQCTLTGGKGQLYMFHLHYGTGKTYITSQDLPDKPSIIVRDNIVYIPGPGIEAGPDASTPFAPPSIPSEPVPSKEPVEIFTIKSTKIKTKQLYIYKREDSDEKGKDE
ncbi:pilus assembly protein [Pseudoalteromonas sp. L23]|uniref:pilus assembly protein n=1 Tax=unclassified Pseudoalteromonas TaxID=194690 RepID=UPI001EF090D9|nr:MULTISPECIES: PilC/PilY family type IV pilus protein [unclassified Pseudoalteromonas]MCF7512565.1 pilus assembly protein [Pseudoalteromonas sp. L7]MCF7524221.1 pilus assembly protein [Pseudoalteromonas sp. L23]